MLENKISVFDSMKSALSLWKKHFVKISIASIVVFFPTQICVELALTQFSKPTIIDNSENLLFLIGVIYVIRFLIGSVALLGIINFSVKMLNNEEEQKIREIIFQGLKRWPQFIKLRFVAGYKISLYFCLLFLPGIFKSVRLSFVDCVVSTNNNIFIDECHESEQLVENHWWEVFGFLCLFFTFVCLFELLYLTILYTYSSSESQIISIVLGVTIQTLETYLVVFKANYYFNRKKLMKTKKAEAF